LCPNLVDLARPFGFIGRLVETGPSRIDVVGFLCEPLVEGLAALFIGADPVLLAARPALRRVHAFFQRVETYPVFVEVLGVDAGREIRIDGVTRVRLPRRRFIVLGHR
jgi:hypothetical protein